MFHECMKVRIFERHVRDRAQRRPASISLHTKRNRAPGVPCRILFYKKQGIKPARLALFTPAAIGSGLTAGQQAVKMPV
jgi:hypothetical protein